jgi:hypothetical protein
MLKHFAAATLGFAVLFGAMGSAFADKSGHVWTHKHLYLDTYPTYSDTYTGRTNATRTVKRRAKKKFDPKLDFETEAVWRNLRPEWFDD